MIPNRRPRNLSRYPPYHHMNMHIVLYAYIAIFTLIVIAAVATIIAGKSEDDTSTFEHVLDLLAAIILWLGMLMFAIEVRNTLLQYTWIALAVFSAVYVIVSSWRARRKELSDPESEISQPIIAIADVGVCFMLLPALIINIMFGISSA